MKFSACQRYYLTFREWLSILEASFIIFRLEPYFENFGKRIIKSSKLFFTDVGIVSYLLDIETIAQVARDPLRGGLIENLVLLELIKARLNQGKDPHFYFYRDSQQNEVDIIYKVSHALIPIEVKSSKTVHQDFFKGLSTCFGQRGFALINRGDNGSSYIPTNPIWLRA